MTAPIRKATISSDTLLARLDKIDNAFDFKAAIAASAARSNPRSFLLVARPLLAKAGDGSRELSQKGKALLEKAIFSHPALFRLFLAEARNPNSAYARVATRQQWVGAIVARREATEAWRVARLASIEPGLSRDSASDIFECLGLACASGSLGCALALAKIYPRIDDSEGGAQHARGISFHTRHGLGDEKSQALARSSLRGARGGAQKLDSRMPSNAFFWIVERWRSNRAEHPEQALAWAMIGWSLIQKGAPARGDFQLEGLLMSCAPLAALATQLPAPIFSQSEPARRSALLVAFSLADQEDIAALCALDDAAPESLAEEHSDAGRLRRAPAAALALMAGAAQYAPESSELGGADVMFRAPKSALSQAKSGEPICPFWEEKAPSSQKIFTLRSLAKAMAKRQKPQALPELPPSQAKAPRP